MSIVVAALVPIFALIVVGALFARSDFPGGAFWPLAARLTYFAFLPALLTRELATARLEGMAILPTGTALAGAVLALTLCLLLLRARLCLDNRTFTSVYQGSVRPNTYVGLAAAPALAGDAGGPLAALAIAALIPLVNLLSVMLLTRYGAGEPRRRDTLRSLLTNPLLLACLLGLALNWSGVGLPFGASRTLDVFSRAALPLGLLTVGAGLDLRAVRASTYPIVLASGLKLLALPAIAAAGCDLLGVGGAARTVAVLFAALPCSPSSYTLAQQLGGDEKLMARILTMQTPLAALTMPVALTLLAPGPP